MQRRARTLTGSEIHSIFAFVESKRDLAIFTLGIYTGLRIGEIISLKAEQVFTETDVKKILMIDRQKQKHTMICEIPMMPKLQQVLLEYKQELLGKRDSAEQPGEQNTLITGWLFPSEQSTIGHLSRTQANNILSKIFKELKLNGATTHSMRRTMLMTMTRNGVPLRVVKQISGHSNLSSLQDYLDPDLTNSKQRAIYTLQY